MTAVTKSRLLPAVLAALAMGVSALPASADSIPGLRGHDHTGITVPDVKAATAFFTDVHRRDRVLARDVVRAVLG